MTEHAVVIAGGGPTGLMLAGAVAALLEHASNSALVPLGCAVPDAALLQSHRLDLALARAARQHGARYNVYGAPRGDLQPAPRNRQAGDARRARAVARRRARSRAAARRP